jgi:hypothetical protein
VSSDTPIDRLPQLLAGSVEHLLGVWDESRALFPYSTKVVDGCYVNDYEHQDAIRYSINSLLGLAEAARVGRPGPSAAEVEALAAQFLARHEDDIVTCADAGLLTLLLAEYGEPDAPALARALGRLTTQLGRPVGELNMQDLAWALWGSCAGIRAGLPDATELGRTAFGLIRSSLVVAATQLPRHSTRRYRRDIVSFGSLVYFLRAMHEYAETVGDDDAEALFNRGVGYALGLQGPQGEWPWLMHAGSGRIVDVYPVFSVHQDSMAMLFLLPARDRGLPGAADAVPRSLAWCFGENELALEFYVPDPFVAYRSIERNERAPRLRRYARSLAPARGQATFGAGDVHLNPECRSYHLGWVLFAWAARSEALGHLA